MDMQVLTPSREKEFEWLNPEKLLYFGYNLYVADDPATAGTERGEECRRIIRYYTSLKAEHGSLHEEYLMSARAVVASYAGAIWRLRKALDANIEEANADWGKMVMQSFGSRMTSGILKLGMRLGVLAVLTALGAALAQIFAPFIPQNIGEETGRIAPSVAGGAVMFVAGYLISFFWSMYHQLHIDNRFNQSSYAAWEMFMKGRVSQYDQHLFDLCEIWKDYVGRDYVTVSSIHAILEDDRRLLEMYFRQKRLASRGHFQIAVDALKSLRRKPKEAASKA